MIMQLAAPAVGVMGSWGDFRVDSGNVFVHPFKRARTTGTYLAARDARHRRRSGG